jgi:hypothetical protein
MQSNAWIKWKSIYTYDVHHTPISLGVGSQADGHSLLITPKETSKEDHQQLLLVIIIIILHRSVQCHQIP